MLPGRVPFGLVCTPFHSVRFLPACLRGPARAVGDGYRGRDDSLLLRAHDSDHIARGKPCFCPAEESGVIRGPLVEHRGSVLCTIGHAAIAFLQHLGSCVDRNGGHGFGRVGNLSGQGDRHEERSRVHLFPHRRRELFPLVPSTNGGGPGIGLSEGLHLRQR